MFPITDAQTKLRAVRKIAQTKEKARQDLVTEEQWTELNYANNFERFSRIRDNVDRVDGRIFPVDNFVYHFVRPSEPCVITHCQSVWDAKYKWTLRRLARKYRNQRFKCGEDLDGNSVQIKIKYYIEYMLTNKDDSPMYIFESSLADHPRRQKLLDDYKVPRYFKEDLFSLVDEANRPPYRWFVMGPARSGTGIHVDPLGTSAWNALVVGHKRWCLFPENTPIDLLKVPEGEGGNQRDAAIVWFDKVYPKTKESTWPGNFRPVEILQCPGEIVFVPSGWWHVVLNLNDTVAITHNFCNRINFPIVWHKTARSRPNLARLWLAELEEKEPQLAAVAKRINPSLPIDMAFAAPVLFSSDSDDDYGLCDSTKGLPMEVFEIKSDYEDNIVDDDMLNEQERRNIRRRSSPSICREKL